MASSKKHMLLLEEQTILSRERTMQQYMTTGLSFIGVGLIVLKFFFGSPYIFLGSLLLTIGFSQIVIAYYRFEKYRVVARKLRKKEKQYALEVGE
ncbi:MAG TPA: DUF202 domain-containing protein [Nanoarchaeota archaeon]|nr:DUF202 domain-containing protein [Nanoarchaeota archaeon]